MNSTLFNKETFMVAHFGGFKTCGKGEGFYRPPHHHDDYAEILLLTKGEGIFHIDGECYIVGPQTLICYNQGVWHEELLNSDQSIEMIYLSFSHFQIKNLPPNHIIEKGMPPVLPLNEQYFKMEGRIREIITEMERCDPESSWVVSHLTAVLLGEIARHYYYNIEQKQNIRSKSFITKIKKYIHENYPFPISLHDLSKITYMSPYHLCRQFKKEMGMTPIHYVIVYRMEVAKHLLLSTDEPITAIAKRVGYESETHFHNVFKKLTGVTPKQVRDR